MLGSIYVRNLLLNLLVVVAVAIALLGLLRGATLVYGEALDQPRPSSSRTVPAGEHWWIQLAPVASVQPSGNGGPDAKHWCEICFIGLALLIVAANPYFCGPARRWLLGAALVSAAALAYFVALLIDAPGARVLAFGAVAGGVLFCRR